MPLLFVSLIALLGVCYKFLSPTTFFFTFFTAFMGTSLLYLLTRVVRPSVGLKSMQYVSALIFDCCFWQQMLFIGTGAVLGTALIMLSRTSLFLASFIFFYVFIPFMILFFLCAFDGKTGLIEYVRNLFRAVKLLLSVSYLSVIISSVLYGVIFFAHYMTIRTSGVLGAFYNYIGLPVVIIIMLLVVISCLTIWYIEEIHERFSFYFGDKQ